VAPPVPPPSGLTPPFRFAFCAPLFFRIKNGRLSLLSFSPLLHLDVRDIVPEGHKDVQLHVVVQDAKPQDARTGDHRLVVLLAAAKRTGLVIESRGASKQGTSDSLQCGVYLLEAGNETGAARRRDVAARRDEPWARDDLEHPHEGEEFRDAAGGHARERLHLGESRPVVRVAVRDDGVAPHAGPAVLGPHDRFAADERPRPVTHHVRGGHGRRVRDQGAIGGGGERGLVPPDREKTGRDLQRARRVRPPLRVVHARVDRDGEAVEKGQLPIACQVLPGELARLPEDVR